MIGPETTGFDSYVTSSDKDTTVEPHWYSGNPRVAAIGNHLYDAGVTFDSSEFFDRLRHTLDNGRKEADMTMTKRLFMVRVAYFQGWKLGRQFFCFLSEEKKWEFGIQL